MAESKLCLVAAIGSVTMGVVGVDDDNEDGSGCSDDNDADGFGGGDALFGKKEEQCDRQ